MKVHGHTTGSSHYPAVNPPEFHVGSASGEMTVSNVPESELGIDVHPSADEVDISVQVEAEVDDGEIIGWNIEGAWLEVECGSPVELDVSKFSASLIDRIHEQAESEANGY